MGRPNIEDARRSDCGRLLQQNKVIRPVNTRDSLVVRHLHKLKACGASDSLQPLDIRSLRERVKHLFTDRDGDALELGGTMAWLEPVTQLLNVSVQGALGNRGLGDAEGSGTQ